MEDFAGRKVLVTGSTRGLGNASAMLFLARGASVVFHGRSQSAVDKSLAALPSASRARASGVAADLDSRTETDRLVAEVGAIDILVNCAGIYEEAAVGAANERHWDRMLEINLTAPWRLSRAFLPALKERRGVIVNVASDAALLGYALAAAYCASKGAMVGLTRALATELAPLVRAVCVCPGPIDTDMMRQMPPAPDGNTVDWQAYTLLGRIATPEEIAPAIVFAASSECSYQTGSILVVDGGASAGRRIAAIE